VGLYSIYANLIKNYNMNVIKAIFSLSTFILIFGCTEKWNEHFVHYPETVNQNVWEVIQNENEISEFVKILRDFGYDTLFKANSTYTLFIPTNQALAAFKSENIVDVMLLNYLISPHFVQSMGIREKRKIQTLGNKFALFENQSGTLKLDGVVLKKESPLFKNGKYFIMNEVVPVKPNIYEYYIKNNPILKNYIDSQDSIIIDKVKSKPKGFDQNGNTVYDTVSVIYNKFEGAFFPAKQEFRHQTATIVFPKEAIYNDALTIMAKNINSTENSDYSDIPVEWQNQVLIPHLLKHGVFENMLETEEFQLLPGKTRVVMKNIQGDSVRVTYKPVEKSICSNGYAYNYENFVIPDSLYMNPSVFEAEWLLKEIGANKFAWHDWVEVKSSLSFTPNRINNIRASNDSLVSIIFPKGYTGSFSVEFSTRAIFPRKYLLVVNTNMGFGGIYDIYVNDELVRTFDYYDFVRYRQYNFSVTGERYVPNGNFNRFDMWVENIKNYGPVKIRFEYKGPGLVGDNGFLIDYISFIPFNK
jgi:uncharacterized surface protein with fasciclin (FAS1) repeats